MPERPAKATPSSSLAYAYQVKILLAQDGYDLPECNYPTLPDFISKAQEAGLTPARCRMLLAAALSAVDRSSSTCPNIVGRNMALDRLMNSWDQYIG